LRKRLPKRNAAYYLKIAFFSTIIFAAFLFLLLKLGVSHYKIEGYAKCYPVFYLLWVFAEQNYKKFKNIY
jgi:hypothetical protein